MEKKQIELMTVFVCITIVVVAAISALTIYNMNDRANMAKNIEAAISKGIDPLSVKCAYDTNTSYTCMAYSLANGKK